VSSSVVLISHLCCSSLIDHEFVFCFVAQSMLEEK